MKDPTRDIRIAYGNLLKGNVSLSGRVIPVYDRVPEPVPAEYIRLGEQSLDTSPSGIGCNIYETTILFDIVTTFQGKNQGGKSESDLIAAQLIALVLPDSQIYPVAGTSFQIVGAELDLSTSAESQQDSKYYIRRLIRIKNIVQQL